VEAEVSVAAVAVAAGVISNFSDSIFKGNTTAPQFTNFICINNAAQTVADISAIEVDKAVEQTVAAAGTPDISGNYTMDGKIKPKGSLDSTLNRWQLV
jgi:hypothetical protein